MISNTTLLSSFKRLFSTTTSKNVKVTVLGCSGGVGQPVSLLLKMSPLVKELSLYDIAHTPGVAADLSHINVCTMESAHTGPRELGCALLGADIVVHCAGLARNPGMTHEDTFKVNSQIGYDFAQAIAAYCPNAMVAIISNPVNVMVALMSAVMKECGICEPRIFGVTTIDVMRASTFVGRLKQLDPSKVTVPVLGGHTGHTVVPVLSQTDPCLTFTEEETKALTKRIQFAGQEVIDIKAGRGSATLCMAYSGVRFVNALARAIGGEKNVVETSFVSSNVTPATYYATPLLLGKNGVEKNFGLPPMNHFEHELFCKSVELITEQIKKGEDFVRSKK